MAGASLYSVQPYTVQLYVPTELVFDDGTSGIQAETEIMLIITSCYTYPPLTKLNKPLYSYPVLPTVRQPKIIKHSTH